MTNTWQEDLQWYRENQTTAQIGFNPDNMCLKVCRTSRDIPAMHGTAKQAQDATPKSHRVTRVRDLRKGMKLYFDETGDSNTAGHIVTHIGRVRGYDPDSLDDILVETNSVVPGQLVVVRASYFQQYWGDSFQFGTDYLNGVEFDYFGKKKPLERDTSARVVNFRDSRPEWDVKILDRAISAGRGDLRKDVARIEKAVAALPKDKRNTRVTRFVERFNEDRVLETQLLNQAVNEGRSGQVRVQLNEIRAAIKSVLMR